MVAFDSYDERFMQRAIALAQQAATQEEVPVGAVIVYEQEIIGEGFNAPIAQHDPCAHAEIQALRAAAAYLKNYRLLNTTLYVSLEPCAMCAGAIILARVQRVVFGAWDPKTGAAGSQFSILGTDRLNHKVQVEQGLCAQECGQLLKDFFKVRRL